MSRGFASNYRIVVLAVAVFACFSGVGARLVYLHVIDREHLIGYIEKARRQITPAFARRGDILDAKGLPLATSRSLVEVGVDPQVLRKEDEAKWPELAGLLQMPLPELEKVLTTKVNPGASAESTDDDRQIRWAKLGENVSEETYDRINALKIKGVYGNRTYRRAYPHNQLAAHVIGYVNKEDAPSGGIEHYADFFLRGQNGWRESEKDGRQREMAQFRTREVPASDGYTVVLSIDSVIQDMVEHELDQIAKTFRPEKATIIVSDAQSGFILALANYPTFNLNEFNKADMASQRNIAITDQLEPGSTFKIVAASGALNEGLVGPDNRFDCSIDRIDYKGRPRSLPKEDHRFDHPLSVREIIGKSSNRGAAQLGMLLGDQRMYDYARRFGFGERTGFPLPGEIEGTLAPVDKWDGLTITRLPMGHSVGATPLQVHYAMGVVASGGLLLRPQIIREVRDASGEVAYSFSGASRRRVITAKTAEMMAEMLTRVASKEGTAPEAAIPNFGVAGKTGTTQKLINGQYSTKQHIGSFVGFFPANHPKVVISVIVDNGHTANGLPGYGRVVAAPSFKRIGEQLIQYLDIKPMVDVNPAYLAMKGDRP